MSGLYNSESALTIFLKHFAQWKATRGTFSGQMGHFGSNLATKMIDSSNSKMLLKLCLINGQELYECCILWFCKNYCLGKLAILAPV